MTPRKKLQASVSHILCNIEDDEFLTHVSLAFCLWDEGHRQIMPKQIRRHRAVPRFCNVGLQNVLLKLNEIVYDYSTARKFEINSSN